LKDVFVHSSPGFDISCFEGINTDTLLSAGTVSMEFKITDIIKGNYTIERIGIKDGRLNLFTDTAGLTNYEITAGNEKDSAEDLFTINLDRINLSDVVAVYNNRANKLLIKGFAESGHLKSRITGNDIDFSGKAVLLIDRFQLYNFSMAKSVEAGLDINLRSTGKGIIFDNSIIGIDDYNFGLSGSISSENVLDLYLTGKNIDISGIKNYVPDKHLNRISAYDPSGTLNIESKFTGPVTRTSNPRIDINFMLENGSVTYGTSAVTLKDLSFKGFFTNGSEMLPRTSCLNISDFEAMLGSAGFSGSLDLSDFTALRGTLNMKGQLYPAEIREFFNLSEISTATGVIDFDMQMAGAVPRKTKYSISDFFDFNPQADLYFKSFGIGLKDDRILFSDVAGNFLISNNAVADNMKFTWKDQQFEVNGKIKGFNDWMAG
ncbi:MAG: hypothetical protein JXN62_02380, partial [Bacteroidales bacterium]|nr:hypothetical protein [Bacteroidales bacterium]